MLVAGLAAIYVAAFAWQLAETSLPPADRPLDWTASVSLLLMLAVVFAMLCTANGDFPASRRVSLPGSS
ncbi:MAG: hypothetical protein H6891_08445 [Brucellaceae bacterium]|nr:hypothetical protein [Brucellaceae bacterium]